MKTYDSKNAIYKDFAIALKFGLEHPVHITAYDNLFDAFARNQRAKLTEFAEMVNNFGTKYPLSYGFFVEMEVRGDTGQILGTQLILLEHETGWEFFIPLATTLAIWLGTKVADEVAGKAIDLALEQLAKFMKEQWQKLIRGGVRIDHVEVRTENKGVMRIPFSQFDPRQVGCLLEKFPTISHLRECNDECFGGMLVEPPARHNAPQASD